MKSSLEQNVLDESRHQFIYGNIDSFKLENLQLSNPVFVNRKEPMAVYINDIHLPNISKRADIDLNVARMMATEYLNFNIACRILENLLQYVDHSLIKKTEVKFVERINRLFINESKHHITNVSELFNLIKQMKSFYYNAYVNYLETEKL